MPSQHLQIIKHRHQQHSTARNQCSITMPQGLEHWPLETSFPSCQSFRRVLTTSQNQDLPRPKLKLEHLRGSLWKSLMHSSVPSMYFAPPFPHVSFPHIDALNSNTLRGFSTRGVLIWIHLQKSYALQHRYIYRHLNPLSGYLASRHSAAR
jgi:hypothetical protein